MDQTVVAYVSWGLWVANCPDPDCLGAEHFGHAPITGRVGGLTAVGFRCARCALVCRSQWPANAADIEWVLAQRPRPETRNWLPHETLEDLLVENIVHGIVPEQLATGPMQILDGRIQGIELAAPGRRLAVGGGA